MSSAPKKLDVLDKWRARVLFRDTLPANDSWAKRMERQMAVLRVSFPFLTEKQLRGKAWTACGLRSLMGELPRSGLSLQVKRTFMKKGTNNRFTMSPKPKIKKEPATYEEKKLGLSTYSCIFDQSNTELLLPQGNIGIDTLPQATFNYLNSPNLFLTNEIGIAPINSDESVKMGTAKRKLIPKKVDFNTQENSPLINIIIPETSETWKEVEAAVKYRDIYCSQIAKEKVAMVLSTDTHSTATQLQNIQKPIESLNIDSDSTFCTSNSLPTPQNYWSNPMLNKEELALYECTPIKKANIENAKSINFDEKSSKNQQILKCSSTPHMIKYADSKDINTDFNSNQELIDSEFSNTEYQNFISDNAGQNRDSTPFILSQTFSLPSTPQEPLENQPLLSNLCCEYKKAYNEEEYKPVPYTRSTKIVKKLKEDFDKIIPPQVPLMKYFEAEEKSFKQIKLEVRKKVNNIILALEEDESREVSKTD